MVPLLQIGWLSNKWLLVAILSMLALQITGMASACFTHRASYNIRMGYHLIKLITAFCHSKDLQMVKVLEH